MVLEDDVYFKAFNLISDLIASYIAVSEEVCSCNHGVKRILHYVGAQSTVYT